MSKSHRLFMLFERADLENGTNYHVKGLFDLIHIADGAINKSRRRIYEKHF